jgi:hypothetical protein
LPRTAAWDDLPGTVRSSQAKPTLFKRMPKPTVSKPLKPKKPVPPLPPVPLIKPAIAKRRVRAR